MNDRRVPNIVIDKVKPERAKAVYDAIFETSEVLFATGTIPKPSLSMEDVVNKAKEFLDLWEKDDTYLFHVLDEGTNQFVGTVMLNQVNRRYLFANLGYWVRASRMGEGIATRAAILAARYGFEQLGLQRIEIVVSEENTASLRVAEKLGAVREGLLRNRLQIQGSPCDAYMHSLIPNDLDIHISA